MIKKSRQLPEWTGGGNTYGEKIKERYFRTLFF